MENKAPTTASPVEPGSSIHFNETEGKPTHFFLFVPGLEFNRTLARVSEPITPESIREHIEMQATSFSILLCDLPVVKRLVVEYSAKHELMKAKVELAIRDQAQAAGTKLTEGAVSKWVQVDPRLRDLERALLDLRGIAARFDYFKDLIAERNSALRSLVSLSVTEFYATKEEKRDV